MERSNQQTADTPSSTRATAMRAGVQNPSGSNYQVAGPTIGGTATPYNPDNIEVAKERLADSLGRASLHDNTTTTTHGSTGTDSTLKDQVISGASTAAHTAVDVTKTVAAGAAAAGAATVSAVKSFFAGDKSAVDHSNPASTTAHTTTSATNKTQPIADFPGTQVHNIHVDSTPETPTHAATGPIHSVPVDVEPIHTTGLDSSASKTGYRAKEADLHATSGVPASKVDVHPTTKLNQGYNTHHSTTDIDARPSTGSIDARPTTTSASMDSRPLTEKVKAPVVGATSAMGAAAAGTAAYLGNKASEAKESVKETVNNLTTPSASSGTPSSTTSSHATMDSTKGTYNPSVSSSTSYTSPASATTPIQSQSTHTTAPIQSQSAHTTDHHHHTTTSTDTRPLTEKVKAPVVGAASAMGAAAAGTAAYLGNKASEAKESVKETANNMSTSTHTTTPNVNNNNNNNNNTYSTSTPMNTPTVKTTTYMTASDATPAAIAEPMIQTTTSAINPVTKTEEIKASTVTPVTEPAIARSPTLDNYQTKTTTTNSSSSLDSPKVTTSSSRPMTEKVSAPLVGAAAAGTAAYLGNKAMDAKNSVKDSTHNMSTPSGNNTHTTTSYNNTNTSSYNTPSTAPTSYTTSSNTNIPAYEKTTTTKTYPSTTTAASAPIMAAASAAPHMSNTSNNTTTHHSSATPNELKTADTIAAGIPTSYHGSIPQVGPGEEVVWVKTVTTTDYDDGTSTGRADVVDRHQEAIDPSAYSTVKDDEMVFNNKDHHMHQQEHKDQSGAGRHL